MTGGKDLIGQDPVKGTNDLRAAVQHAVMKICCQNDSTECSPRALAALSELTYLYATTILSPDLIAFSDHASRRTITEADVKLAARRNPGGILDRLKQMTMEQQQQQQQQQRHSSGKNSASIDFQKLPTKSTIQALELSSDESSLDEAMLMQELDRSKAEHQVTLLDDLERETSALPTTAVSTAPRRNLALSGESSDNEETDKIISRNQKSASRKRFRLSAIEDSSSSSSEANFIEEPKTSRIQQILAGMSSDEENEF